jgi:hypothetical protein
MTVYKSESKAPTPRAIWAGLGGLAGGIGVMLLEFATHTATTTWEQILSDLLPAVGALIAAYFAPASPVVPAGQAPPPGAAGSSQAAPG